MSGVKGVVVAEIIGVVRCQGCFKNVEAVREGSSALHCTMLLKLCGLQTGMNLVVRIMCQHITVHVRQTGAVYWTLPKKTVAGPMS